MAPHPAPLSRSKDFKSRVIGPRNPKLIKSSDYEPKKGTVFQIYHIDPNAPKFAPGALKFLEVTNQSCCSLFFAFSVAKLSYTERMSKKYDCGDSSMFSWQHGKSKFSSKSFSQPGQSSFFYQTYKSYRCQLKILLADFRTQIPTVFG